MKKKMSNGMLSFVKFEIFLLDQITETRKEKGCTTVTTKKVTVVSTTCAFITKRKRKKRRKTMN